MGHIKCSYTKNGVFSTVIRVYTCICLTVGCHFCSPNVHAAKTLSEDGDVVGLESEVTCGQNEVYSTPPCETQV